MIESIAGLLPGNTLSGVNLQKCVYKQTPFDCQAEGFLPQSITTYCFFQQKRAGEVITSPLVFGCVQYSPQVLPTAEGVDESWVDKGGGIGVAGLVEGGASTTGGTSSLSCTRIGS